MARPLLLATLAAAVATWAAAGDHGLAPPRWKLEAIELTGGRRLEGLVLKGRRGVPGPNDPDIEFLEVRRPPGRKTHLISWPSFPAATVRFVERLAEPEHLDLAEKIDAFRADERRRAAAPAVSLSRRDVNGPWAYAGPEFTLESTADATVTREAVVRLELVLAALTSLVQPVADGEPLTVRLFGSLADYRRLQRELGLGIGNQAFYLRERRLLAAGSELSTMTAEWRAADELLDADEQWLKEADGAIDEGLRDLTRRLEQQGDTKQEREEAVRVSRQRWSRERDEFVRRIEAARAANDAVLARARASFDARLAHEAWHAYADQRLRPPTAPGLPAWLDEGLAQVIESAPVEANEVRLDLFDRERLGRLQGLLQKGAIPPIAEIVSGGQEPFISGHAGGEQAVAYLTAWGLALDLAIVSPVLSPARIAQLTAAGDDDAVARFEALVGMPIDRFDRTWRDRMNQLGRRGP